jgi:hypothetical protein
MYLITLYQIWCSYHIYVKKAIKFMSLWHHSEPFGLLSSYSSCFFRGVRPSFSGLMSYPYLFGMLNLDHSYTNLSFPTGWSPYFLDVVAHVEICIFPFQVTVWDTCPMLPMVIWSHVFFFWKFNSVILSSNVIFFDGPITQARIYFISSKCSFKCCANTFLLLCRSSSKGLVISLF